MTDPKKIMVPISEHGRGKIKLKHDSSSRSATLLPIIKYCLEKGAKFKHHAATKQKPFVSDKSGVETCILISNITVNDILNLYVLPKSVTYGQNGFWDSESSVELSFMTPEKHKELERKSTERREKRERKRIARKVKLNELQNRSLNERER